jgi:hypothetical protein
MNRISPELGVGPGDSTQGPGYYHFTASEVEVYKVLSVATPGDAALILSQGIRTAEDALKYLHEHGAAHRAVKRTKLTAEALKRGIDAYTFMERVTRAVVGNPDDDSPLTSLDVMELSNISALSGQYGHVAKEVLDGTILLADIKCLGVSKLKASHRLINTKPALIKVHDSDSPFSMDDLKYLVDRVAEERSASHYHSSAVCYLVAEGVQGIKDADSLQLLHKIDMKYLYVDDRYARVTYEIKFRKGNGHSTFPSVAELNELRTAGVDPESAGRLMKDGLSVHSIIAVEAGNTEKALAEGWL